MLFNRDISLWILLFLCLHPSRSANFTFSWNQPKFCPDALWNPDGTVFAVASDRPYGLFVHQNKHVYAAEQSTNRVDIWSDEGGTPIRTLSQDFDHPGAIFVATNGDIYVDHGNYLNVQVWTPSAVSGTIVMNVTAQCLGLFIDINDTLFCSVSNNHQVVARSLQIGRDDVTTVAGNGTCQSTSDGLCLPNGIFVDTNFNLYVADWANDRIQKFNLKTSNSETVAGKGAERTVGLSRPSAVVLDADNYLFIVDMGHTRIVGSGPNGYRCVVGCAQTTGSQTNEFHGPRQLAFDEDGNLFVTDRENNRILTFELIRNCSNEQTLSLITTESVTGVSSSTEQMNNDARTRDGFVIHGAYCLLVLLALEALIETEY